MANWENLQRLMSELLRIYQEILALSKQKKNLLVAGNPAALDKVVKQEEVMIVRAGKIDAARQQVIAVIVTKAGSDHAGVTMSDLLVLAPESVAAGLRSTSQQFERVLTELKVQNSLNTQLLKQALNLVNFNINLLTQNSVGQTYSPRGSHGQSVQGRTMFDRKG